MHLLRFMSEPGAWSVYTPTAFAEPDIGQIHEFLRRHSFATLVTNGPSGLVGSHLPLLLDSDAGTQGVLLGHMARANPQWRQVEGEALAVFSGPHAYVSPSWYEEDAMVPTWNYVAVHVYGTFQVVEEENTLLDVLRRSVRFYEGSRETPWVFNDSAPYVGKLLKAIVGFRIEINRLEGKWKLSQNHTDERRRRVIGALEKQPDDDSQAIAALMSETPGRSGKPLGG